jgi:hypothetical protein
VISYTVFDPDDGSGRTYWWYGEAMVYVHQDGREVDAFELDLPSDAYVVAPDPVAQAISAYHQAG